MRGHWFGWSGWIFALFIALATVGVPNGLAAVDFADGAFVQGRDGVFVWYHGMKIAISPAADTTNSLANIAPATTVTTAGELAVAMAAGGGTNAPATGSNNPPATGSNNPPATGGQTGGAQGGTAASAAQYLVGQAAEGCYGTARFYVSFDRVELVKNAGGRPAPGNSLWLIGVASVQNVGGSADVPATTIVLVDERGRQFDPSSDVAFTTAVANTAGVKIPYDFFGAGTAEQTVFVYQIPPDVKELTPRSAKVGC